MSLPMIRPSTSLANQIPDGFSRSEANRLVRLQNAEVSRGLVAATAVQADAFVTLMGIQAVGVLTREAEFHAAGNPHAAARNNLIVDQFALAVARKVGQL